MCIDIACQFELLAKRNLGSNDSCMCVPLGVDERRVCMALGTQALHINLSSLQLWLEREALTLDEQSAVLENHRVATIHHILCRFAKATRRIDVATHSARTLLSHQRAQVVVLADELVAGREVQDDIGTRHRQVVAGRNGCPDVLADFHAKLDVTHLEELGFSRQTDRCASQIDIGVVQVLRRGKPALLVELTVVGQIGLRHNAQQGATLDNGSAVEQQTTGLNRQAYHADDVELTSEVQQLEQSILGLVEQQFLLKQVLTCVTRQRQFGEAEQLHALAIGQCDELLDFLYVVLHIGYAYGRYGCSHLDKSVFHI